MSVAWRSLPIPQGRLYEGARWIAGANVFQWVDILSGSIHRWDPDLGADPQSRSLGLEFATVALPLSSTTSLIASRSSIYEFNWETGLLERLASWVFEDDIRFNDGALAPNGDVYIGTMSMAGRDDAGGLFRFDGTRLVEVLSGVGISNGLVWASPTRAFYVDSTNPRVDLLVLSDSQIVRRSFYEFDDHMEPDGLTLTPFGEPLVAMWGSATVAKINADGSGCAFYSLPARYPSSIAVGGRDNQFVLVTTASVEHQRAKSYEHDGCVFVASATEIFPR